jgi:hypothetical protein
VQSIAQDIWNKYFYGYFGAKNNSVLLENSAMFIYPLMLPADAVGSIMEMRVRDVIIGAYSMASDKFFSELCRIYRAGKLTPALWFKNASASDATFNKGRTFGKASAIKKK